MVDYAAAGAEVDWMSHPALTEDASLEVAGLGYWECSDGTVYWAVIATGTADASTPKDTPATTPAATTEEASPEPVEVVESTPEMAAPAPTVTEEPTEQPSEMALFLSRFGGGQQQPATPPATQPTNGALKQAFMHV